MGHKYRSKDWSRIRANPIWGEDWANPIYLEGLSLSFFVPVLNEFRLSLKIFILRIQRI